MRQWEIRVVGRILGVAIVATAPISLRAQQVFPAGVAHHQRLASTSITIPLNPPASLAHDVKRGAVIGGVTGAVLGLVGIAVYVGTKPSARCCEQASHDLRFGQAVTVEAVAVAGGALIGAVLGYGYHSNRPTRSASRTMQPNGC